MILSRLIKKGVLSHSATATVATPATLSPKNPRLSQLSQVSQSQTPPEPPIFDPSTVATVATVAVIDGPKTHRSTRDEVADRLRPLASRHGFSLDALMDWFRDDIEDLARMSDRNMALIVRDLAEHHALYGGPAPMTAETETTGRNGH